jgi:hypothetical protein
MRNFILLFLGSMANAAAAATPDVSLALNEAAVNDVAQQLKGLEIKLANGAQLKLTSITLALENQHADFQLGVEARSTNPIGLPLNLTLIGSLREAVRTEPQLTLPVELTDVQLANGLLTPLLKLFFGEWLTPARWNAALPALALPASFAHTVSIPSTTTEVGGELPMTVTTQAWQIPLSLALMHVGFTEDRLHLALQLGDGKAESETVPFSADHPLAARINRQALAVLLQNFANANAHDLHLRLKPARIRQEQIETVVRVTNYTDVESGEGQADLKQITVEQLHDGALVARLLANGTFHAKVNGREYGIPYRLSPHGQFGIQDRGLSLRLMNDDGRLWLQAMPGELLPVDIRMNLPIIAGRTIGFDRQIKLPAERVVNHWELPALWAREFALPRKLAVAADRTLRIVESQPLTLSLKQVQAHTRDDALALSASVGFALYPNSKQERP